MNMKHFLCLLFCLSFLLFPVYAQESYETYSGDTFKTGDVLTLGDFYLSSTKYSHLKTRIRIPMERFGMRRSMERFAFLQGNNP